MSTNDPMLNRGFADATIPVGFLSLCTELSHTAQLYLRKISLAIDEVAPRPGFLVYAQAKKLGVRLNGLDPIIFSAIDATTQLQVAQVYLAITTAAAVSFIDFVAQTFPFGISQIRTRDEKPFHNSSDGQSHRDFTAIMGQRGYVHSVIANPSQDALFSITSNSIFGGLCEGSIAHASEQELQRNVAHFLFFHNNYRSIPWLGGKTPLQKLKTFEGFAGIHSFDPYGLPRSNDGDMHVPSRLPEAQRDK